MPTKHFCAHGHFYQPPRVDPFTNKIPQEFGAAPHSNWTEKIYYQCYKPNADLGNFGKMSFNIGPTLFSWLDKHHPETVLQIVEQENHVFQRTGLSNAMAHPYFHMIFPLASRRDKDTMLIWGIRDFEIHFGHKPAGLWLPETAVDLPSLEALADHGIFYTILAPWQAFDENIDTAQAYRVALVNGKEISVFFYNRYLSSEISFNPSASENADIFVNDWLIPQIEFFNQEKEEIFMGASDGELYGHHMLFREKFLSHLLDGAVEARNIINTFPSLWLRDHPPIVTMRIQENTSWSCHHGIERWRDVCGDAPTATWKKPLRNFLNALCNAIDGVYERQLADLIHDPWALRNQYIEVLFENQSQGEIIQSNRKVNLDESQLHLIKTLLQAQFERLRMLSSDAWFFYDLDRIEPLNALKYAAHAVSLVEKATGIDTSENLIPIIAEARSEISSVTGDICFLGFLKKFEQAGN
jgi:alpha-amylase/alpha-mannosidase (GH57 family)